MCRGTMTTSSRLLCAACGALCLALAPLAAAAAQAPKVKETSKGSVVALVAPFSAGDDVPDWAGYALEELVTDLVAQAGNGSFVSSKQLDSVLRRKDLQLYDAADLDVALPLAKALGATDLVVGELKKQDGKLVASARRIVVGVKAQSRAVEASGDLPSIAVELADKLLDAKAKTGPMTTNAKALEEATVCWQDLVKYPLQPRVGTVPPLDRADVIEGHCKAALDADPKLGWARAGLGILLALKGQAAQGRTEAKESQRGRFNAYGYVAEAFAARRMGDLPAAKAALEWGIKERPGFLLAVGYLAEDRMEAEDYKAAATAWDRYLKKAPHHPYAMAQKGKALGYLQQHRDALSLTRQALDFDPGDPELLIELGSRLIDAKQFPEAESTLRTAMDARPPRPLAWLRLGWLYLQQKKVQDARDVLVEAVTYAYREDEARTRGLAFVDLAQVAGLQQKPAEALEYLNAARSEGIRKLPCEAPALAQLKGKPEFESLCAAK
jgi:tetratricopeptide (TPR) repeat protein